MGVAPEAIAKKKFGYRLKYIAFFQLFYSCVDSSGAHQALPIIVAPEATIRGCVATFYRLKYCSAASLFIPGGLHISSLLPLYMLPLFFSLLGAKCQSP
jgi:hypothetical protein